jgi:hypothetical protein
MSLPFHLLPQPNTRAMPSYTISYKLWIVCPHKSLGTSQISLYATYMTAVNGLYNAEYNTEMLKRRSPMKHHFIIRSIKAVRHELVLKIDSLNAVAFISLYRYRVYILFGQYHGISCLAQYHITICGWHIITNLILQSTLHYYTLSSEIHRFLVDPRNIWFQRMLWISDEWQWMLIFFPSVVTWTILDNCVNFNILNY